MKSLQNFIKFSNIKAFVSEGVISLLLKWFSQGKFGNLVLGGC